jgi:hypothetical protein
MEARSYGESPPKRPALPEIYHRLCSLVNFDWSSFGLESAWDRSAGEDPELPGFLPPAQGAASMQSLGGPSFLAFQPSCVRGDPPPGRASGSESEAEMSKRPDAKWIRTEDDQLRAAVASRWTVTSY